MAGRKVAGHLRTVSILVPRLLISITLLADGLRYAGKATRHSHTHQRNTHCVSTGAQRQGQALAEAESLKHPSSALRCREAPYQGLEQCGQERPPRPARAPRPRCRRGARAGLLPHRHLQPDMPCSMSSQARLVAA